MTIRPNHPIVKFAYMFNGFEPHRQYCNGPFVPTSLCPLFWRCVVNMIAVLAALALVSVVVFFGGRAIVRNWRDVLLVIGGAAVGIGVIFGISFALAKDGLGWGPKTVSRVGNSLDRAGDAIEASVAWQMVKAVKSKMCPIVRFETPEHWK